MSRGPSNKLNCRGCCFSTSNSNCGEGNSFPTFNNSKINE